MKHFTTGQVARICHVSNTTVNKWLKSGLLRGFRLPGSTHRRFPEENLRKFMRDHDMEFPVQPEFTLLMITHNSELVQSLHHALDSAKIVTATNSFEAGMAVKEHTPECIIMDFAIGAKAQPICGHLQAADMRQETVVIGLFPGSHVNGVDISELNDVFYEPFDRALLAERILSLKGSV